MKRRARLALAAAIAAGLAPAARAGGPAVSGGSATVASSGNVTIINQTSSRAVYTWPTFNLPAGGILEFNEPSSSSIALNRVTSGVAFVNGTILSNGQVWIIDPAGVMFGHGASVNVAGLIATTSDIAGGDQNFVNGGGSVTFGTPTGDPSAAVVNNGTISISPGGAAVLAGARVMNNGLIEAQLGTVVLAGAGTFTVDFTGDKLINFAIGAGVSETPLDRNGNPAAALVANAGTITAEGGQVLLTARAARSVLTNVINTSGMIEATSAHDENGTIVLDAGDGVAEISGTLDVSGKLAGETGGTVTATGGSVTVNAGALIDASGDAGGGSVALGGDFHGAGPLADATTTTIAAGAVITASAITTGNGGSVAVWSNGTTVFDGTILAKGGAEGGNGGTVETSGEGVLTVGSSASVLTGSSGGTAGTWLLDPFSNLTITTASLNSSCTPGNPLVCDSTGDNSEVMASTIETALNDGTSVTVETTNPGAQNGSITVASAINVTSSVGPVPTLTLSSEGAITINQPIAGGTSAPLNVVLTMPSGTAITVGANITTGGGSFSATGTAASGTFVENSGVTISTLGSAGGTVNISMAVASGEITLSGTTNAGGVVTLTAGPNGVILGGPLTAASGAITIISAGNISTNVDAPITSDGGAISLTANSSGVVTPTGSGSIALNANIATDGSNETGGAISLAVSGGTGTLALGGDLLTQGGAITLNAPTVVSASVSVDSTDNFAHPLGAAVTFDGTVNDIQLSPSDTLSVTSGDNTITFNGEVGGSHPLEYLQLNGGGNGSTITTGIDIEAPMTLAGSGASFLVNQNVVIDAPITEPSGSGTLIILAGDSDAAGQIPPTSTLVFGISGEIDFAGSSGSVDLSYRPASFPNNDPTVLSHIVMGSGTFTPTLNVESVSDLEAINSNLSGNFALDVSGSTLDLSSVANFAPFMIGSSATPFTGSFDGGGNTIANLTISSANSDVGLFGYIGSGATVETLALTNANVIGTTSGAFVGALAGENAGFVTTVSTGGAVSTTSARDVGGLVGHNVGGGTITQSHSSAAVSGSSSTMSSLIGGLVGINDGSITQSYATGSVTGGGFFVTAEAGGLVGGNNGSISESFATGEVLNADQMGGLVGFNYGSITAAYATGAVIGVEFSTVGGLVASNDGTDSNGTITQSYSTGLVSAASPTAIGGLVGLNQNGATVTNSYWDMDTSGQTTSAAGTGEHTAALQGALPSGFTSGPWAVLTSPVPSYPYLTAIFATTPEVVTGTAYSGINVDPIAGEIVAGQVNGTSFGQTMTGADGYYYFLLPNGSIPAVNGQVITSAVSGGVNYSEANAFADNADGSVSGVNFSSTSLRLISSGATASGIFGDLATAVGSGGTGIGFTLGANNVPSLPAGESTLVFITSAPVLTLDIPINLGSTQLAFNDSVGGSVEQTQPFTAANLTLVGSGATYTLTNPSNSFSEFAANTGSASIADAANLSITALGPLSSQTLGATLTGSLTINDTGTVTQTEPITAGGLALLGAGGSYTLTTATNSIGNLAANTGTITLDATGTLTIDPAGSTNVFTTSGNTNLSATSIALGSTAAVTVPANAELNLTAASGGSIVMTEGATISAPSSSAFVLFTANSISLTPLAGGSASITGSGGIDLEGVTDATTIGVGTSAAGTLNINQTTLNAIGTPLSIGAEDKAQTGLITVAGPVTFSAPTGIGQIGQTGQIDLSGTITSTATVPGVANGAPPPFTGINYFLAILAPTVLQANTTINTAAAVSTPGAVVFASTIDGATFFLDNLTVNAGAGDIDFAGRVGYDGGVVDSSAVSPGAVSLTTTGNVNMTMVPDPMPADGNTDGFAAASFSLTGPAASLTASSFISTHGESGGSSHPNGGTLLIDTTGNVSIAGDLSAGGGINASTPSTGGNSGTVTVDATAGSVAIGTSLPSSSASVLATGYTTGADSSVAGQGAGSGANVSITGTSITIGTSIISNGGAAEFTGSVGAGGNAGTVSLTTTTGGVTMGESVSSGNLPTSIAATGGTTAASANGGNGAAVSITALTAVAGSVSLPADLVTVGGEAGGSGTSGFGGAVTIDAGGTVAIGTALPLVTQYSGSELKADVASILTRGGETYTSASTPGNGGQIQVTGASISLPFGASSGGGEAADLYSSANGPVGWAPTAVTGYTTPSTANGANAGPITLTATAGAVTVGTPAGTSSTATGDVIGVFARGGDSTGGNGGAGANVTISGDTVTLARVGSFGGDTLSATGSGGAAGNLSLTATSAVSGAITLYGNNDPATGSSTSLEGVLSARGGFDDMAMNGFGNVSSPATISGAGGTLSVSVPTGGTIVLATSTANTGASTSTTGTTTNGSNVITSVASTQNLNIGEWISGPGIPAGSAIVSFSGSSITITQNATSGAGTGPIMGIEVPNGDNNGSTVGLSASGGLGHGGAISVTGPIEGAAANTQSLRLLAADGAFTTSGAVGDVTSLANITIGNGENTVPPGGTGGSLSFGGAVTVGGSVTDLNTSGSLAFDGPLTTPALSANGPAVSVLDGALFSNSFSVTSSAAAPLTLGGDIVFGSNSGGSATENIVLSSATTLDLSSASSAVTLAGTVDGTTAGAQAFTFDEPQGGAGATISATLGGTTALGAVTVNGAATFTLENTITTAGGAVQINSPAVLGNNSVSIDTTNGGHTAAGANVTFNSTLDGTLIYSDNLRIHAGSAGNITFGNVGATVRLGTPIISSANAVDFTGTVNIAGLTDGSTTFTAAGNLNAVGPTSSTLVTNGGTFDIVTTGAITIGGGIIATGGLDTATNAGGNGGSVTINGGGAVSIGSAITLTTSGSGSTLVNTSVPAVVTSGFSATTAAETAGGATGISITGSSVTLAQSVVASGGNAAISGSSANGGSAATINITATSGSVTIGSAATGNLIGVIANGGNSFGGTGGRAGNVTISGQTISLSKVSTNGGDSALTSAATAQAAGNITLNATASSGDAVVLFGNAAGAALAEDTVGTLTAIGGEYNDTNVTTAGALPNGTITGTGGNISIEAGVGQPLNGTADVRLENNSANAALNGGPSVSIVAPGGLGTGGTILIDGPVVGTTANIENLRVSSANGSATLAGSVGAGAIPLGTLVLGPATNVLDTLPSGSSDGNLTVSGAVNVETLDITGTSGSATFDGFVTASTYNPADAAIVTFNGGSSLSGGITISSPLVLNADDTIDSNNGPITIDATIDDSTAGADTLTLDAGTGTITINDPLGGTTPLGAIIMNGVLIDLDSNITTKAGAVTFNGPVVLTENVAINTAALGSTGANVTFNSTLDAAQFLTQSLTIAAGTAGNVNFTQRVGFENAPSCAPGNACSALSALTITSADAVNATMPFGNSDGIGVGTVSITGVASVDADTYIATTGGPVTITASGAVSIGADLPLTVSGDNVTSLNSVSIGGASTTVASQPAANGGNITITAGSINLPFGVNTDGGTAQVSGTAVNGGNGGTVTLTATGTINAGSLLAGPQMDIDASGGDSISGSGGNGGNITISGANLLVAAVGTSGGSTQAGAPQKGGNGGAITLIATANSGAAVVLFGTSNSATGVTAGPGGSLLTIGGDINDPTAATDCSCISTGTVNGAGGNITIEGSSGGAALAGSAFIELQNSTSTAFGGPTVLVVAAGGTGAGGTVTFDGPVQATTADVENLHFEASNGSVTITGPVGTTTALGTLAFGFTPSGSLPVLANSGAMTFDGAVTVGTAITDLRTAGSLAFDGLVTAPIFAMTAGATSLTMTGGAAFTGLVTVSGGATTLAGTFTFSGGATGFTDTGPITLTGATTLNSVAVAGPISLGSVSSPGAIAEPFTVTAGSGAVTFTGALSGLGAVDITGGTLTLDGITSTGNVTATSSGANAITVEHAISASGTVALTAGGNLTLDAGASVTGSGAGNAVVLATGGVFDNLAGSGGVVANGGGRWLIWSQNPTSDTVGGLPFAFKQYDATFGVTTPAGAGDGLLYTLAPTVTAGLTGAVTKTYDATTGATLTAANYTVTGGEPGDSFTLNDPTSGTYASANAGIGIGVTVTGVSIVSASSGGKPVFGYTLASPTATGAVGSIALLDVVLTGSKTYDGTTNAPSADLTIANNLSGANLTISGTGTLASANAGSEAFASAGTLVLGGSAAGNYTLGAVTTNGSAVTVGALTVVLSGAKTFDGTTNAPAPDLTIANNLSGANLTLSGTGTLSSANAGSDGFASAGSLSLGGSAAGNYTLGAVTTNGSAVTVGALAVVLSGAKTFDGTTNAPAPDLTIANNLSGANLTLSGTGTLSSANAGSDGFASAGSLSLGGSAAGNYTLGAVTTNGSSVTVGPLAVVLSGAKTFDAATSAPAADLTITNDLSGANLTLSGTGTLAGANAGAQAFASAGTLALGGSAAGNYTLTGITTNGSLVTVSPLAVALSGAKTFDATTNAPAADLAITNDLSGANLTLSGTGTLASANAGSDAFAAAGSLTLGGSAAGNYTLGAVTTNGSAVTVGALTVVLSGAKTYDATTSAPAADLAIANNLSGANLTLSGTGTLASANAGSDAFAAAGSLTLGGSAAGNYTLGTITTNGSAVTVGALTVVLSGAKTFDATTSAPAADLAIANNLSGANLTLSGTGTLAGANVGSENFTAAGTLALGGSAAGNYTLSAVTTNGSAVTVNPLPVVLSGTKTYDATTGAPASILAVSNDLDGANLMLGGAAGTLASANAGSERFASVGSLTLGGSAAGNYTIANVTTNGSAVTITPATLSYVATPTNGLAGAPIPALSGSVTGFQGADTLASATSGTLAFATTATPASPTGTYPITGTGLNANFGNYTFVQAPANATAFTINGSEIVGGDVFSDHGVTALPGATIGLILGGNSEGTVTSGAGGAYQFELPVGTISPSGAGVFVYIASGPVNGNSFYNQATGAITNLDIFGNIFRVLNAPASLTQTGAALAATLGTITGPNFLFSLSGNALNLAGSNFELTAPVPFTIDETVNAASFAVTASSISLADNVTTSGAQTYGGAADVPDPGVTLTGSNVTFTSTIDGPGTLTIDDPGTVTFGGAVGSEVPLGGVSITASNVMLASGIWTSSGVVMLDSTVTLTQNAMIDTDGTGADIDLMGPVNGGLYTLTLDSGVGNVTLSGVNVGGLVFTPSAPALVTLDSGSYDIAGGPYTFGTVALNGALGFGQATNFGPATVISPSTITSPGAPVAFTGTLTGADETLAIEPGTPVTYAVPPTGVTITDVVPPNGGPPAPEVGAIEPNSNGSPGSSPGDTGTTDTGGSNAAPTETSDTGTGTSGTGATVPTGATGDVVSDETASLLNALAPASGGAATAPGAGPLEVLTDDSGSTSTAGSASAGADTSTSTVVVTANAFTVTTTNPGGGTGATGGGGATTGAAGADAVQPGSETDGTTNSIASSLGGAPASAQGGKPVTLVNGVLTQTPTPPTNACSVGSSSASSCKPHSVPPADQEYSSWGNEAYWQ